MPANDDLAEANVLLHEIQRTTNALALRLRILNLLTFALDAAFVKTAPKLIEDARHQPEAAAILEQFVDDARDLLTAAHATLQDDLLPELHARGYTLKAVSQCTPAERASLDGYFQRTVYPLLTPLAVDAGRPFPQISANSLNLLTVIQNPNAFDVETPIFARLKVPRKVPRLVEISLPPDEPERAERTYVLSEDMVRANVHSLFPGMHVLGVYQFRIARGLAQTVPGPVQRPMALARQKAWPVVRLDVEEDIPDWVLRWLLHQMEATDAVVVRRAAPLGVGALALEFAERAAVKSWAPGSVFLNGAGGLPL